MSTSTHDSILGAIHDASTTKQPTPGRRLFHGFSLTRGGAGEAFFAVGLGVYLGYSVTRIHEVFPVLMVPRLPMILTVFFALGLAFLIPARGWLMVWREARAIRIVAFITALAIFTAGIGIWISGSLDFLVNRFFITVTVFLSCAVFLRDRRLLRVALTIYLLAAAGITVKSLFFPTMVQLSAADLVDQDEQNERRAAQGLPPKLERLQVSTSLDPNDYGSLLVSAIPLALWLGIGGLGRRIFWGATALLLVWGIVPTASRGALLGLVAVGFALIVQGGTGKRRFFLALVAAAGAAVFISAVGGQQSDRFSDFSGADYNLTENEGRWSFMRQGMIWMIKRPTGLGIGNYPVYFGMINGPERAAHNSFVQYGSELGVAGLVSFILLWRTLLGGLRRMQKRAVAVGGGYGKLSTDEATLAGHMFASLVGTLVTGFFLSNGYLPLMYMPLGLATAVLLGSPLPADAPVPEATGKRSAPVRSPGWRAQRPGTIPGTSARGRTPPAPPTPVVGS
jgi:hypothetical protein